MSKGEAKGFGVTEADRRSLMRLDSAKVNIMPPAVAATWFRLVNVVLGNGTEEYPAGDHMQTVERWYPPDRGAEVSKAAKQQIFDRLEAGPGENRRYGSTPQTKEERAAWRMMQSYCPNLTRGQCQDELKRWLRDGLLTERPYIDPGNRHSRLGLFVVRRPLD
jgi:hypothetical protein